ncbi:MAG: type II and III secretion system protein family protein [Sphingomonadales bacterium]|nr:type II and III secretion system protein family protein [Sphingomonadales bacterium]
MLTLNGSLRSLALALATVAAGTCALAGVAHANPAAKSARPRAYRPSLAQLGTPARVAAVPVGMQKPSREVLLSIGEGELITLPVGVDNVWVSNPQAADVYVNSSRQLHLFGKADGETTVFASRNNGEVVFAASVRVSQNISSVDRILRTAMPDADIRVTMVGQYALLTGTVASPEDSAQASQLVKQALNPGVKATDDTGLKIAVINRLRTATPLQVNLQVKIAEVSRSLVKTLNSNLTTMDTTGGFKFGLQQGRQAGSFITTDPNLPLAVGNKVNGYTIDPITGKLTLSQGTTIDAAGGGLTTLSGLTRIGGLNILGTLDAGETLGLVTTLAQPNLTALSGETAEFLAGGEFPIPLSTGLGSVSVDYKKYGVSLSYTPYVLANGRISLRVRPEVSELSSQGSVTINGFTIPALTVRRTETTVELGSGQSFMIAGLLQNHSQNAVQKLPGAGDMPVIGALFKSTSFQRGETELVIVVTPYLVQPVNERDIKLPTDGLQSPDDIQRVLGNMVTDGKSGNKRPAPAAGASMGGSGGDNHVGAANLPGKAPKSTASAESSAPGFNLK